jgi:hypothetical protein
MKGTQPPAESILVPLSMDTSPWSAYLWRGRMAGSRMAKGAWGKKPAMGGSFAERNSASGRFVVKETTTRSNAGSALNQTERVAKALADANKRTHTFKPKNAR